LLLARARTGGAGVASVTEERVALPPDDDTDGA
jgi:hypothetical protein